jgi:hypothetical protein
MGQAITAPLIARFLTTAGFRPSDIANMLEPHDAQNVPAAMALLDALCSIAELPDSDLDIAQQRDRRSIVVFSELFSAFVAAFTSFWLLLADQMQLLSKYAHLATWLYQQEKERFLNNVLYTDSIACVKNAYFSLAKQQILDPEQDYFLFQLGTDGVEKLFASARMAGGHNPNFSLFEFTNLLSFGLDVTRILADYPEWYSGHRRLSTSRGEHADHLSPSAWKGNARAGSVVIQDVWNAGAREAKRVISQYTRGSVAVLWKDVFNRPDCDIQRPCSGTYPGVVLDLDCNDDLLMLEGSSSSDELASTTIEEILSHLPATDVLNAVSEQVENSTWNESCLDQPSLNDAACGEHLLNASEHDPPQKVEPLAKKQSHSLLIEGQWVHNVTSIRQRFSTPLGQKQSKDRHVRVRDFAVPTISAQLKGLGGEAFKAGHCFATILRCGDRAFLAIIKTTHLLRAGETAYAIPRAEIPVAEMQVVLRGQILAFHPCTCKPEQSWHWTGEIARLRPMKDNVKSKDILLIAVPGVLVLPVDIPQSSDSAWCISKENLDALSLDLWRQISPQHISKLVMCGTSLSFPYCTKTGMYGTDCGWNAS